MRQIAFAALVSLFALGSFAGSAVAQDAACAAKAIGKDGKPLAGAARDSYIKKNCAKDKDACEAKAIDKNGKPLAGAAKTSFLKKCKSGA